MTNQPKIDVIRHHLEKWQSGDWSGWEGIPKSMRAQAIQTAEKTIRELENDL